MNARVLFDAFFVFFGVTVSLFILKGLLSSDTLWFALLAWLVVSVLYGLKLRHNKAISFFAGFLWLPFAFFPSVFAKVCYRLRMIKK